jgi:hypothetical protein
VLAVLLGLQTKPLDYSHSFIADYTRRYYNLSITILSRRMYNMKYLLEGSRSTLFENLLREFTS